MARVELNELQNFAHSIAGEIQASAASLGGKAYVLFLSGELGAGKTAFVQALAKEMGGGEGVQSPTFMLMRSYGISWGGFERLVHIDAYRFEQAEEFSALRPDTFLHDSKAIVCIEWPDRIETLLPPPQKTITFSHIGSETDARDIEVK